MHAAFLPLFLILIFDFSILVESSGNKQVQSEVKQNKKVVLTTKNNPKNIIQAGETREYKFPGKKACSVTLDKNGNLRVESFMKKKTLWTEVWESDSSVEGYGDHHFFFQLHGKEGILAIFRDGKSFETPEHHWVAARPTKGLKSLYINDSCFFSLEKANGEVHWTNEYILINEDPNDSNDFDPYPYPNPENNLEKKLVLSNKKGANAMRAGEVKSYLFPGKKKCFLTLEYNGNLLIESYDRKANLRELVWESESFVNGDEQKPFLELHKNGNILAIYQGKSLNSIWDANGRTNGLKYLYMNEMCVLSLEKAKGAVHWTSELYDLPSITYPSPSPTYHSPPTMYPPSHPTPPITISMNKALVLISSEYPDERYNSIVSGEIRNFSFMNKKECRVELEKNGNLLVQSFNMKEELWETIWESDSAQKSKGKYYLYIANYPYGSLMIDRLTDNHHSINIWSIKTKARDAKYLYIDDDCNLSLEVEGVRWNSGKDDEYYHGYDDFNDEDYHDYEGSHDYEDYNDYEDSYDYETNYEYSDSSSQGSSNLDNLIASALSYMNSSSVDPSSLLLNGTDILEDTVASLLQNSTTALNNTLASVGPHSIDSVTTSLNDTINSVLPNDSNLDEPVDSILTNGGETLNNIINSFFPRGGGP